MPTWEVNLTCAHIIAPMAFSYGLGGDKRWGRNKIQIDTQTAGDARVKAQDRFPEAKIEGVKKMGEQGWVVEIKKGRFFDSGRTWQPEVFLEQATVYTSRQFARQALKDLKYSSGSDLPEARVIKASEASQ